MAPKGQDAAEGFMTPGEAKDIRSENNKLLQTIAQQQEVTAAREEATATATAIREAAAAQRHQEDKAAALQRHQDLMAQNQALILALTAGLSPNASAPGAQGGPAHSPSFRPPTRDTPKLDTTIRTMANFELYKAELAAHTGPFYEEAHEYDPSATATPTRTNSNKMLFGVILSGVTDPNYKRLILDAGTLADHPHNTASAALLTLEKTLLGDKEERDTRLIKEWESILLLINERLALFAARFNAIRTALRVAKMDKNNIETLIRLEGALKNHPQRLKQFQEWKLLTKHQSEQYKTPSAALKHLQEQADMEERNTATPPPQQQTIALMGEAMGPAEDAEEIGSVSVFIADRGRLRLCFRCALPVTDGHTFRTCIAPGPPTGMSYEDFAAQQNSRRPAYAPKGGKGGRGGKGRGGRVERRPAGFLADGAAVYDDDGTDDAG